MRDSGHSQPPPDLDFAEVAQALAHHAEDISVKLLGEPTSKSRREFRWGRRGSLSLRISGDKRGKWSDFERGECGDLLDLIVRERGASLGEAIRIAERDYLGGAETSPAARGLLKGLSSCPTPLRDQDGPNASDEERTKWALRRWDEAVAIGGTPAERYFVKHRKLDITRLNLDHCLRWHASRRAVVALMTDPVSDAPIGIHRTFLDADGAKIERKMLGRQGVIRLSPNDEVTVGLGITEGIEDGISVLLSGWAPVWAATSAGAIARFPVLAGVEALTVLADADEAGQRAAKACTDRWLAHGRDVCIAAPGRLA